MADEIKAPVVNKDADDRVSSVVLDVHVSADSDLAVQIPEGVTAEDPFAVYVEEAAPAPAAKSSK